MPSKEHHGEHREHRDRDRDRGEIIEIQKEFFSVFSVSSVVQIVFLHSLGQNAKLSIPNSVSAAGPTPEIPASMDTAGRRDVDCR